MSRFILFLALLGLLAAPLAQAVQDPAVCKSMCTTEQGKCLSRASKMTELDKRPRLEEVNPFPMLPGQLQVWSESSVKTDQLAAQRRGMERNEACMARFTRCTAVCEPDLIMVTKQAAAPAAGPAASAK